MRFLIALCIAIIAATSGSAQNERRNVMVVFDMSGSMWGQVNGVAKVEIARDAFSGLLSDWEANGTQTGLIAYGHRARGDCGDIEVMARPGDGADIGALVAGLRPVGKTPLSDAVMQAAEVLKFTEEAATVVLLSDGVETCEADPCAVGAELEALGLDFTAHVIGFDIAQGDKAQLQCLADATGGQYFDAADADELAQAMEDVVQATATPAPAELRGQDFQTVRVRITANANTIALPQEMTIYGNGIALGTVTDETAAIPGLTIDMPFGVVTLRVESGGILHESIVDITDRTSVIDLVLMDAEADYVLWREGRLPMLENSQIVLLKNTSGVDRGADLTVFLYPTASTDPSARISAGTLSPDTEAYAKLNIPAPGLPGDYELVPTANDGTEYARIPLSFAARIDPVWQGARTIEPGGMLDAYWAGPSFGGNLFRFEQDGRVISRHAVSAMASDDGFRLQASGTRRCGPL